MGYHRQLDLDTRIALALGEWLYSFGRRRAVRAYYRAFHRRRRINSDIRAWRCGQVWEAS